MDEVRCHCEPGQTRRAVERAVEKLHAADRIVISEAVPRVRSEQASLSPHSQRRTYASLRFACGDDPVYVAEQGGWADPSFPIRVYARAVRRRDRLSGAHREAFDAALAWASMGQAHADDDALPADGKDPPPSS